METIVIDGAEGEGGGQILRTSLALSMVTGRPFTMERIRAGRARPGLQRQHLASVEAAATVCRAKTRGAMLGSSALEFRPGPVRAGDYQFAVAGAGSAGLVFQTILPPLLTSSEPSTLTFEGGTHNPFAPPFDFLAQSFAPALRLMGPRLTLVLERPGFYPAGGGRFRVRVDPVGSLTRVDLRERGPVRERGARALVAQVRESVAHRELAAVQERLGWAPAECRAELVANSRGPGNAVLLEIEAEPLTAVFSAFGDRGRPAEAVARLAADAAAVWIEAGAPVEAHLADQLLVPMALAGGGAFLTTTPSLHTRTNAATIRRFLDVGITFEQESAAAWLVEVS